MKNDIEVVVNGMACRLISGAPDYVDLDAIEIGKAFAELIRREFSELELPNIALNLSGGPFYFDYMACNQVFDACFDLLSHTRFDGKTKVLNVLTHLIFPDREAYAFTFTKGSAKLSRLQREFQGNAKQFSEAIHRYCNESNLRLKFIVRILWLCAAQDVGEPRECIQVVNLDTPLYRDDGGPHGPDQAVHCLASRLRPALAPPGSSALVLRPHRPRRA